MATRKARTIDPDDVFITEAEMQQRLTEQRKMFEQDFQTRGLAVIGNEDLPVDDEDEDVDAVTALNNVLAELGAADSTGSKGFVSVYKENITGNTKTEKYIGKFEVNDYAQGNLLDTLQASYAGGRYHVRVYAPGGRGFVIKANKWIDIADGINAAQKASEPIAPQPELSAIITGVQQTMLEGFKQIAAMIAPREPAKSTMDMLKELQMMRELFGPAAPVVQPVSQVMDAMKMGMEMAMMNQGGDGNSAWAMKAMDMFGKPILDAVMSGQLAPAPAPAPRPMPALQNTAPGVTVPPVEDDPMNMMIKGYLRTLARAAAANENVEEYADNILSLLPDSNLAEFEKILRAADWQEKFNAYSADVGIHPAWYSRLREVIIAFIDEDNAALTPEVTGVSVRSHEDDITSASAQTNNTSIDT